MMLLLLYTNNIQTKSSPIDTRSPILPLPSPKPFSHWPGNFQSPSKGFKQNLWLCHQHSHKVLKALPHPKLEDSGQDCLKPKEKSHPGHSGQKVNEGNNCTNEEIRKEKIMRYNPQNSGGLLLLILRLNREFSY